MNKYDSIIRPTMALHVLATLKRAHESGNYIHAYYDLKRVKVEVEGLGHFSFTNGSFLKMGDIEALYEKNANYDDALKLMQTLQERQHESSMKSRRRKAERTSNPELFAPAMTLNEYQEKAMTTCMESSRNYAYMYTNLVAEVGEFSGKVAKAQRKGRTYFTHNGDLYLCGVGENMGKEFRDELEKEAGDILWQLSGLCSVLGWSLEDVARMNLEKLASRQQRGVIDGSGDNR